MYIANGYQNENDSEITTFLQGNSFGILINQVDGKPWATHIPLELDVNENGQKVLYGHLAKENPQWQSFNSNDKVLAIFSGPHAYISSSWYDHENAPTWNYVAVHIYGLIKIIEGEAMLVALKKLVDKYEATSANPVRIETLSKRTMMQTRGIVAFEIVIEDIQAVKKMSQNRNEKDHQNIISDLEKTGNPQAAAVATIMSKCPR